MIGHLFGRSGKKNNRRGNQIHCYGDSGTPAMYYAKKYSLPSSTEVQAFAIGIGYSYDKCVEKGPPTKFIKITTPEFFKWLTQKRENIIDVNHKECTLGKGSSTKHVENKGGA